MCKVTPFLVWKSIWYYRRMLHRRIIAHAGEFRLPFKHQLPPFIMPKLGEVKKKAQEKYQASGGEKARKKEQRRAKKGKKTPKGADSESDAESAAEQGPAAGPSAAPRPQDSSVRVA